MEHGYSISELATWNIPGQSSDFDLKAPEDAFNIALTKRKLVQKDVDSLIKHANDNQSPLVAMDLGNSANPLKFGGRNEDEKHTYRQFVQQAYDANSRDVADKETLALVKQRLVRFSEMPTFDETSTAPTAGEAM